MSETIKTQSEKPKRDTEQQSQQERERYLFLMEEASKAGEKDLAQRYSQAARNIGLAKGVLESLKTERVASILDDVQRLVQWGPSEVLRHRWSSADDVEPNYPVILFADNYPDLAEATLTEIYAKLGLTEIRARTMPSTDELGDRYYTLPASHGLKFIEARFTEDDFTTYSLTAQRVEDQ
jgi:hypothetical protein